MKRIGALLIILALSITLCACGGGTEEEVAINLPTRPVSTAGMTESAQPAEAEESAEDAEFREEDYTRSETVTPEGEKIIAWYEGTTSGRKVREICQSENGDIMDSYYYPGGSTSHLYMWLTDGTYAENRFLEDGMLAYLKQINPDGTEDETFYDENGKIISNIRKEADGSYTETCYENGSPSRGSYHNPATGERIEQEYYESGSMKRTVFEDTAAGTVTVQEYYENGNTRKSTHTNSVTGFSSEQEYYENGNHKWSKSWSAEYTMEERYNEEGYCTYLYYKDMDIEMKGVDIEVECFADETGKLIKVIENGEVKEDAETFARYERDYNFRK